MNALWRLALAAALLTAAIVYPFQYTLQPGGFGMFFQEQFANARSVTRHVTAVIPGSPAWKGGIRAGDTLPLANVDDASRVELRFSLPGDRAVYDVRRGEAAFRVHLTARQAPKNAFQAPEAIRAAVVFTLWGVALLVLARAWKTRFGPLIAMMLTCAVIDAACDAIPWSAHTSNWFWAAFFGYAGIIDDVSSGVLQLLPVVLAALLLGRRDRVVGVCTWCVIAIAGIGMLVAPFYPILTYAGRAPEWLESTFAVINPVPWFASAAGVALIYARSQGESRQRIGWLFWGVCPYMTGVGLLNVVPILNWLYSNGSAPEMIVRAVLRAAELALPVSMIYAVLYRRVIDVGFVLNRVAVYGSVSLALVGLFVLLEFAASRVLLETGHTESLLVQLAIALCIGFSVRYLHGAAEQFVDRAFFAKRHADEQALRRFAHESEAYTAAAPLLERAIECIERHGDARSAALYTLRGGEAQLLRADGDYPSRLDENDAIVVKLRRWNEPFDTHDVRAAFPEGMIFPMIARGKTIGLLACGTKRDGTAYDPDEREIFMSVAHGLATSLDALALPQREALEELRDSFTAAIAQLSRKIDDLGLAPRL